MRIDVVSVTDIGLGWLEATVNLPDLPPRDPARPTAASSSEPHRILIPVEAIGSRMVFYGLETEQEALEAILREHAVRLGSDAGVLDRVAVNDGPEPTADERKAAAGGTDDRVALTMGKSTATVEAVLERHAEKITAAIEARIPRPIEELVEHPDDDAKPIPPPKASAKGARP